MLGVIYTNFAEFVIERYGMEYLNQLLEKVHPESQGIYTEGAVYDDQEAVALITELCENHKLELSDLLRDFGYFLFQRLSLMPAAGHYGDGDLWEFLLSINDVTHSQLSRMMPNAKPPEFKIKRTEMGVEMIYSSSRKLCFLAEGLIHGAADGLGQKIKIEHDVCMHKGDDHCEIRVNQDGG